MRTSIANSLIGKRAEVLSAASQFFRKVGTVDQVVLDGFDSVIWVLFPDVGRFAFGEKDLWIEGKDNRRNEELFQKLKDMSLALCHAIEELPASVEQTQIVIKASELRSILFDHCINRCAICGVEKDKNFPPGPQAIPEQHYCLRHRDYKRKTEFA